MTNLSSLQTRASARRRVLDSLAGEARAVLSRGKELEAEVSALETEVATLDRVAVLLNSLGEEKQNETHSTIETLVTEGLQTIFDDSLSFHIIDATKAKTAGVDFIVRTRLETGDDVDTPVMDARGGGLAATIGFLLRTVVLLLSATEKRESLLVLDETFAHVSEDYLESVGEFLRQIVDRSGIQIILVTHQPEFEAHADVTYRFAAVDGRTQVSRVG